MYVQTDVQICNKRTEHRFISLHCFLNRMEKMHRKIQIWKVVGWYKFRLLLKGNIRSLQYVLTN